MKKTPEIRARELFRLMHGPGNSAEHELDCMNPAIRKGWLKLGKHVLAVETKWAKAKSDGRLMR